MSKKKKKNSNYKAEGIIPEGKTSGIDINKIKPIIIWSAVGIILLAIIIALVVAFLPKSNYVEIDFGEYGKIVVELDRDEAPITCDNFTKLVERGFYNGLTIFRAQENFVIQGGRNESVSLAPIKGEFAKNGVDNDISHTRGVISMARSDELNSATSQFFITLDDSAKKSLDGLYAGFGYVIEGMDVVDAIANELLKCPSNSMGFVSESDAIKIVSAKMINYDKK